MPFPSLKYLDQKLAELTVWHDIESGVRLDILCTLRDLVQSSSLQTPQATPPAIHAMEADVPARRCGSAPGTQDEHAQDYRQYQATARSTTGDRRTYSTGAERGSDDLPFFYMPPAAHAAFARAAGYGSAKYKPWNALKGFPATSLWSHAYMHLLKWMYARVVGGKPWQSGTSEDELGHAIWNIGMLIHQEHNPDKYHGLDDRPELSQEEVLSMLADLEQTTKAMQREIEEYRQGKLDQPKPPTIPMPVQDDSPHSDANIWLPGGIKMTQAEHDKLIAEFRTAYDGPSKVSHVTLPDVPHVPKTTAEYLDIFDSSYPVKCVTCPNRIHRSSTSRQCTQCVMDKKPFPAGEADMTVVEYLKGSTTCSSDIPL